MDRVVNIPDGQPKLPEELRGLGMGFGAGGALLQDVSRNLPSAQAASGLAGALPGGPGAGLGAGLGLGNTASLQAGLAGVGGMGGSNLMGGGGDVGLGASLGSRGGGAFGGSGLGGGVGPAFATGLAGARGMGGSNLMGGGGDVGLGASLGGGGGGSGLGGGVGPASELAAGLRGSAGLGGSGIGVGGSGSYGTEEERDLKAAGGSAFANGPAHGSLGRAIVSGTGTAMKNTISVTNLPPSATMQMLREKFKHCGEIQYIEIRNTTMGLVRFASEGAANHAVHVMDRAKIDGNTVRVSRFHGEQMKITF